MTYLHPFQAFERQVEKQAKRRFLYCARRQQAWNWQEARADVSALAAWMKSLGLKPGDKVALLCKNQPEWLLIDLACLGSGIVSVPLYTQSLESEVHYILKEAEVKLFISERSFPVPAGVVLKTIEQAVEESKKFVGEAWTPSPTQADDLMTLIYTSGTTGEPKGVMHSARNFCLATDSIRARFKLGAEDQMFSYLPLSHVVERMLSEFLVIYSGAQVAFIDSVERVAKALPSIRPTVFAAVPRIWDILRFKVEREIQAKSVLRFLWNLLTPSLREKVFGPLVRKKLGFSRAKYLLSGAAALSRETAEALAQFGIRIIEGYGLTETLTVSTFNEPGRELIGSVGPVQKGVDIQIRSDGEVALRAAFHFQGYYKKPELTAEVMEDGWFLTGDVGYLNANHGLHLTDRKKNIFKTSNGKYVAPCPIENRLKTHPMVQEVMVVGENQPHCIALVSVNPELYSEKQLLDHLQKLNKTLAPHEKVHALGVSLKPWSIEAGELTPTMKLKRKKLLHRYEKQINMLYQSRSKLEIFSDCSQERNQLANSCVQR